MVGLTRPLEGVIVAALCGLGAIVGRWRRGTAMAVATTAVAYAAGAGFVGAAALGYNAKMTGSATSFPITAYTDRHYGPGTNQLGFGPQRGLGWTGVDPLPGHGLADVLINADMNVFSINTDLFGWSVGCVLLPIALALSGQMTGSDRWMWGVVLAIVGAHSFFWFSGGPDFGARYWFLALPPCVALTVRGAQTLARRIASQRRGDDCDASHGSHHGARVAVAVAALSLLAMVNFLPWRAIDKYHHYRGMRPDIRELAESHRFGRSLILVRGNRHPDYASAAVYNPLDWHADAPIYAWDRDETTRRRVLAAYEDRDVWVVDGPTKTHAGFQVVEGPTPARELLAAGRTTSLAPQQDVTPR
jgi:hypothetical protein